MQDSRKFEYMNSELKKTGTVIENVDSVVVNDEPVYRLEGKFKELFTIRVFLINLIILVILWTLTVFNFYLIPYLL